MKKNVLLVKLQRVGSSEDKRGSRFREQAAQLYHSEPCYFQVQDKILQTTGEESPCIMSGILRAKTVCSPQNDVTANKTHTPNLTSRKTIFFARQSPLSRGKAAFTLAEVLITLVIIGIVAAMTMPTLIQKNQDKELISRIKKVWSDINNSLLLAQTDYGVIGDNGYLFNSEDDAKTVAKNWAKYFNGSKVCETKTQSGCAQYYYELKYATLRADSSGAATVSLTSAPKIILSNGAIISVDTNKSGCDAKTYTATQTDSLGRPLKNPDGTNKTYTYTSTNCANIQFDVNGNKNPNQFGRDAFHFWVYRNKLDVAGGTYGGENLKNIITGKDEFKYTNYTKGQQVE